MRRRQPKLERLRFRVFDERVREALKTMTTSAAIGREIEAAVSAGPLALPADYFVLELSDAGLALRQVRAARSEGAEAAAAGTETVTLWPLTTATPPGSAGSPPPRSGA